ncbi:MAG: HK97 family phage prohead protease [Lachnospiraceae bacterium]|nr:HK97 family phage prohead protease [Lachnospiraceae bacterium]
MDRETMQYRTVLQELKTRAEPDAPKVIEGYFAVFGSETELWEGAYEEIAPEAFDNALGDDVRALINHDTTLVLGRTKASTLELTADSHGLFARIIINEKDTDAMNLYERVQRGDVNQCSFGFDILREETEWREDGSVKWIIREVKLYEVSVCTFPAYRDTEVQARSAEYEEMKKRKLEIWKQKQKARIKNGTESINAE